MLELPNHAEGNDSFEIRRDDIRDVLKYENDTSAITLWHSHPAGGIGPSTRDMKNRTPFPHHLVVALVDNDLVATWY